MFVLHLTMSWKNEIKTKKSISKNFGRYLKSNHAVLWSLYIDDRIRTPPAFIRLQPTCGDRIVSDRVHRKRINRGRLHRNQTGNWTPYVSSIAIGAQTDRFRVASDRQQSVIWSGSITALQNVDWRSVVIRSPPGLIDRCQGAIGGLIGRNRTAGTTKSPQNNAIHCALSDRTERHGSPSSEMGVTVSIWGLLTRPIGIKTLTWINNCISMKWGVNTHPSWICTPPLNVWHRWVIIPITHYGRNHL